MTEIDKELLAEFEMTLEEPMPQIEGCETCGENELLLAAGAGYEELDEMDKELFAALLPEMAEFGLSEELGMAEEELRLAEFEEGLQAEQELEAAALEFEESAETGFDELLAVAKANPGLKITFSF